jgi:hypothetical protein
LPILENFKKAKKAPQFSRAFRFSNRVLS